jgi:hypothetical protein
LTFKTEIQLRQFYEELKDTLFFENLQDFLDHILRKGLDEPKEYKMVTIRYREASVKHTKP